MIISLFKIVLIVLYTAIVSSLEFFTIPFNRTGKMYHALAKLHSRGTLAIAGVRLVVEGLDRVDFSRSYVYVSNHASLFDIPAVLAGIPDQIRIIYKKELEKLPIFGWALKYGKTYIAIDRGKGHNAIQSLEAAAEKIRTGASVILFAEGTRTSDGKLQPFKRGPFNLAVRSGVPIVPVTINGSYRILPKKSLRIRPGTVTLVLGRPIEPAPKNGKQSEFQLSDQVHRAIEQYYQDQ